jgi:rare lipoprotein A (peptidoglycan hydrolase)
LDTYKYYHSKLIPKSILINIIRWIPVSEFIRKLKIFSHSERSEESRAFASANSGSFAPLRMANSKTLHKSLSPELHFNKLIIKRYMVHKYRNSTIEIIFIQVIIVFIIFMSSCSSSVRFTSEKKNNGTSFNNNKKIEKNINSNSSDKIRGFASFYADKFEGNMTACGEIYFSNKLTAAHRELECGTMIRVRNISNNKSVIVKINDKGPFIEGRIIDLSRAAAAELSMINAGVVEVEIEIVNRNE